MSRRKTCRNCHTKLHDGELGCCSEECERADDSRRAKRERAFARDVVMDASIGDDIAIGALGGLDVGDWG
jgi:hypothetical protein